MFFWFLFVLCPCSTLANFFSVHFQRFILFLWMGHIYPFLCMLCELFRKTGQFKNTANFLSLCRLDLCRERPSRISLVYWHNVFLGLWGACIFSGTVHVLFFLIFPYTWRLLNVLMCLRVSPLLFPMALDVLLCSSM